jgi:hypothetical protein
VRSAVAGCDVKETDVTTVLGVDPGGRTCGLVLRDSDTLVDHQTVVRDRESLDGWCRRVVTVAGNMAANLHVDLVAVEGLNDPTPHMGTTSVRGLIDTSAVIGALVCWASHPDAPGVVLVPPARHGRAAEGLGRAGLVAAYPGLVGPRETSGTGELRHCRAAWDVAGAAIREQLVLTKMEF